MRLLQKFSNPDNNNSAKVYYNGEYEEYIVVFYRDGVNQKDADYHTDCGLDAQSTAKHFVQ